MTTEEIQIKAFDGVLLYGKIWKPKDTPKAFIAILHGLSDHINRFNEFSEFMNANNIGVIGFDQPGHGNSPGKRGHIISSEDIQSNVQNLLIETRLRFSEIPLFLYGQSMGGNIALNFGINIKSKELTGLIVSSPWIKLAFEPPAWKISASRLLNKIIPGLTMKNEIDPMELSHDPKVGRKYLEDSLNHGKISTRLYNLMMEGAARIIKSATSIQLPVLLMHGDEDKLTSHKTSEAISKNNSRIELKIWSGMRHELHGEKGKEQVMEYIVSWINKIIDNNERT